MTDGYSRAESSVAGNREPAAIIGVDPQTRVAQAILRSRYTVNVDCSFAVGDAIITPAVGEQWYIERFDMVWRLSGRIPFNDPTLNVPPEPGQVSVGAATGPLELNGTQIRTNGVFVLNGIPLRDNGTRLERSPDGGTTWIPVASGGGGGGDITSTDDLDEGVTNKYYTAARVAADAPVKSVAGKTGIVTLAKADVGLSNVDYTSDSAKPISSATASALGLKADLVSGIVPDSQLPEPVVRQYANSSSFPAPGDPGVIYLANDTALIYRWDGAAFTLAGGTGGGSLANTDSLTEGSINKYYTDARVATKVNTMYGTASNTICQGNDSRLSDTRTPTNNTVTTAKIVDGNVTAVKLATDVSDLINAPKPYDVSYPQTLGQRAVGYGSNTIGIKLARAVTFDQIIYRCGTADASGNLTVEVRKNGTLVSGTQTTIASGSQVTGGSVTGSWAFAAGDVLTVYISAVGTTPGLGLVADLRGTS